MGSDVDVGHSRKLDSGCPRQPDVHNQRLVATKQGALVDSDGTPTPSDETDGVGRPITYVTYDNAGEAIEQQTFDGDGVAPWKWKYLARRSCGCGFILVVGFHSFSASQSEAVERAMRVLRL